MGERHVVLIVEDDKPTVEDLVEVLRSIDCDYLAVDNYQQALEALESMPVCLILLDLQIKRSSGEIKGHVEHGNALLREIRRIHGDHAGLLFWLPVLIVSGFAREASAVLDVMKSGASDVIHKPLSTREVSEKIRAALEASGRLDHHLCGEKPPKQTPNTSGEVIVSIPGERVRRRTVVVVSRTRLELTTSSLRLLLHLVVAYGDGVGVHKTDLGANAEQGFKGISNLRSELKPALGPDADIISNDYHGTYGLTNNVRIGACDTNSLLVLNDPTISDLALRLNRQLESRLKV